MLQLSEFEKKKVEKNMNEIKEKIEEISLKNLIKKGLTYPSALISLSWLLVEPEVAIHELMSVVKGRNDF